MSGATRPKVEKVDPTNPAIQPLQQQLSRYFQGFFQPPASGSRSINSFQPNQPGGAVPEPAGSNLDLPMFSGDFGAGLNDFQLDAIGSIQKMLGANPIVQTQDIQAAIGRAGAPTSRTDFSNIQQMIANFTGNAPSPTDVGESTDLIRQGAGTPAASRTVTDAVLPSLQTALSAPRFDNTEAFRLGEGVFQEDLDRILAGVREEASGLGLGPGATDRNERLLRTAGSEINRFRLGQQDLARQAFESAEARRLGAVGQVPGLLGAFEAPMERLLRAGSTLAGVESLPFQQALQLRGQEAALFPLLSEMAQVPFREDLAAAGQEASLLPTMLQAFGLPAQFASQLFGMGEAGRQADDTAIARQIQEFGRTQGGRLQQMLQFMGITPEQMVGFGPSTLSQGAQILQGIGEIIPDSLF